jgi:hypothetical protein
MKGYYDVYNVSMTTRESHDRIMLEQIGVESEFNVMTELRQ